MKRQPIPLAKFKDIIQSSSMYLTSVVLKPQATVLKFSEKGIKYPLKILMHKI